MPIRSTILFLFIALNSFAQIETIKVKKETAPTKKPVVTLAGTHNGEVSLTKLCSDKKFRIKNNIDSLEVVFCIIQFSRAPGALTEWVNSTDSLNNEFFQYLISPISHQKTKVNIYNVKGKNKKGKEVKLNDIIITILK